MPPGYSATRRWPSGYRGHFACGCHRSRRNNCTSLYDLFIFIHSFINSTYAILFASVSLCSERFLLVFWWHEAAVEIKKKRLTVGSCRSQIIGFVIEIRVFSSSDPTYLTNRRRRRSIASREESDLLLINHPATDATQIRKVHLPNYSAYFVKSYFFVINHVFSLSCPVFSGFFPLTILASSPLQPHRPERGRIECIELSTPTACLLRHSAFASRRVVEGRVGINSTTISRSATARHSVRTSGGQGERFIATNH